MQIGYYLSLGATTFWCTIAPTINKPKMIAKSAGLNVVFIFKILNDRINFSDSNLTIHIKVLYELNCSKNLIKQKNP